MTAPEPQIRIWQQPDGLWRWCYVEAGQEGETDSDVRLISHRAYDTEQEARDSARTAYPGLDLPPSSEPESAPAQPRKARRRRRLVWLVVVLALIAYTLRRRRSPSAARCL